MDAEPPPPRDEPPAANEETPPHDDPPEPEADHQPDDAPTPDDHDEEEWRPGSAQVPASWDMLIGAAARGRSEEVQAFRMSDVSVLREEGYNIDPRDIRRRRI